MARASRTVRRRTRALRRPRPQLSARPRLVNLRLPRRARMVHGRQSRNRPMLLKTPANRNKSARRRRLIDRRSDLSGRPSVARLIAPQARRRATRNVRPTQTQTPVRVATLAEHTETVLSHRLRRNQIEAVIPTRPPAVRLIGRGVTAGSHRCCIVSPTLAQAAMTALRRLTPDDNPAGLRDELASSNRAVKTRSSS